MPAFQSAAGFWSYARVCTPRRQVRSSSRYDRTLPRRSWSAPAERNPARTRFPLKLLSPLTLPPILLELLHRSHLEDHSLVDLSAVDERLGDLAHGALGEHELPLRDVEGARVAALANPNLVKDLDGFLRFRHWWALPEWRPTPARRPASSPSWRWTA